ncbi:MAG: DUF1508 domain-containing protein [Gammaproteobacteria bacterium]|nr:DUF1508 domain-containing protein [Gammaproteobacteria bacterium]
MRAYDEACIAPPTARDAAGPAYHVYKDSKGAWRWRLLDTSGEVIASSGESYKSRTACLSAIELLKKLVGAPVAA